MCFFVWLLNLNISESVVTKYVHQLVANSIWMLFGLDSWCFVENSCLLWYKTLVDESRICETVREIIKSSDRSP